MMWTAVHVPSVTLPVFKGPHGMPVGAQLIARHSADRQLFAVAKWIHQRLT
jgi:Asp-tRNA(Asn)/Glu-tRNA(Gln) amidotransferase A subunit family amidase